jgi:hypothetical protein
MTSRARLEELQRIADNGLAAKVQCVSVTPDDLKFLLEATQLCKQAGVELIQTLWVVDLARRGELKDLYDPQNLITRSTAVKDQIIRKFPTTAFPDLLEAKSFTE